MTQAQLAEVVGGGVTEEEIASYETGEGLMPVPTFVRKIPTCTRGMNCGILLPFCIMGWQSNAKPS